MDEGGERKCDECREKVAKYRCPGCSLRSCSLPCVKSHKQRSGCTGKRDPTAFVAISDFDDNRLVSDYNFLEEALRVADVSKRTRFKRMVTARRPQIKPQLKDLLYQSRCRKTKFVYIANGMSRRSSNTTFYDRKRKCIFWRIEWVFDSTDLRFVDEHVDEHLNLGTVLEKHLTPQSHTPTVRHQLRHFLEQPMDQLKLLYKKEFSESQESYYEFNIKEPLREQLAFKSVVEFPVIRVVLPSEAHRFSILEDPRPAKSELPLSKEPVQEIIPEAKRFREEQIKDEEDMDMFNFLEDLPGKAAMLWEDLDLQPQGLTTANCADVEEGEISS